MQKLRGKIRLVFLFWENSWKVVRLRTDVAILSTLMHSVLIIHENVEQSISEQMDLFEKALHFDEALSFEIIEWKLKIYRI